MASSAAGYPQIVQAASQGQRNIRQAIQQIAKLVFGNATDLDPSNDMFHAHPDARQGAIVALGAGRQCLAFGLFFGCRCRQRLGA